MAICIVLYLTWKVHINEITRKISKNVGIISRIAHLLPQSIKLNLYYSLVYPYLSYCNLIWALTYPSRLKGLIILQKRAVRVIAGASRREHSAPLFSKFKILTINEIGEYLKFAKQWGRMF